MSKYYQGFFKPKNPQKYAGNPKTIVYRSSWEFKYMMELDHDPNVVEWSSEEFSIPYKSPIDNRIHRYFPDFKVKKKNAKGIVETFVIEIKPSKETKEPKKQTKTTKKYLNEVYTWGINSYKWKYAEEYCKDRNWNFQILTEKHLRIPT